MAYKHLSEAIAREELAGLAYMFWARLIAIAILAGWAMMLPFERSGFYLLTLAAFALLGAPPYLLARPGIGGLPVIAAFLLLDAGLLSYILIVPTPYAVDGWTPQLSLRLWNFLYLGVFLVGMVLTYSPALVIWTGIATVTAWSAGYLWIAKLPDSLARTSSEALSRGLGSEAVISEYLDPRVVSLTSLQYQIVFLVLVTIILTLTVWRSRRLVHRQVAAEAQRSALSRYFSPNIVRELSTSGGALDRPAKQPVAVLFADMVGFTAISERLSPEALVELLREFHGRLARVVFAHDGTIDKYIGDEIRVHFGTPRPRKDDPVRALACAAEMIAENRALQRRAGEGRRSAHRDRHRGALRRGAGRQHRRRAPARIHGFRRHRECGKPARAAHARDRHLSGGERRSCPRRARLRGRALYPDQGSAP
jgi:adenylate cyclase